MDEPEFCFATTVTVAGTKAGWYYCLICEEKCRPCEVLSKKKQRLFLGYGM
jgi:hypothetical protein